MNIFESLFAGSLLNCLYFGFVGIGLLYTLLLFAGHGIHVGGIDIDIDLGSVDTGDVDFSGDAGIDSVGISTFAISAFITAFGTFGIMMRGLFNANDLFSFIGATIGGIVFGGGAQAFFVYVLSPTTSSVVSQQSLVGKVAEVITPIGKDGLGQVAIIAGGSRVTYSARSSDKAKIPRGTTVNVDKVVGGVVHVSPQ